MKIFQNRFKPSNFYQLRHIQSLTFKTYQDEDRIGIKDGMLRLWKTSKVYKDYGSSLYKVYSEAFINYTSIIVSLFRATSHRFQVTLTQFYRLVLQLLKVYDWKEALLSLAIEVHIHIVTQQPSNQKQWIIYPEFQERFCITTIVISINMLLGLLAKKKSSKSLNRWNARITGSSINNPSVVCNAFNKNSCIYGNARGCINARSMGAGDTGLKAARKNDRLMQEVQQIIF